MHLAVDPTSHEILLSALTKNNVHDGNVGQKMMKHLPKSVKTGYGDGAYDQEGCYKEIQSMGKTLITPPRKGGCLSDLDQKPYDALRAIRGLGNDKEARAIWKKLCGYHKRSIVETSVYRFKKIFGEHFSSRNLNRQQAELYAKSIALNKLTRIGMP